MFELVQHCFFLVLFSEKMSPSPFYLLFLFECILGIMSQGRLFFNKHPAVQGRAIFTFSAVKKALFKIE